MTPGVTFAVPLNEAVDVLARLVLIVRAVSSFVADGASPSAFPVPPLATGSVPVTPGRGEAARTLAAVDDSRFVSIDTLCDQIDFIRFWTTAV